MYIAGPRYIQMLLIPFLRIDSSVLQVLCFPAASQCFLALLYLKLNLNLPSSFQSFSKS